MKKRAFLFENVCIILLLLFTAQSSFSQNNFKVTGKIIDNADKPVNGATVQVKGTTTGTATKAHRTFEIKTSENSTLVVSYVGFLEKEVPLRGPGDMTAYQNPGY